ncbi:unnamed protein product, partial [Staurois parvus]
MLEQYRYPPNDPFLQSRQPDVFHKRHGEFFEVVIFLSSFFRNEEYFFFTYCH